MGGCEVPQRHHLACGSFWDSERHFGEDGDPPNLGHQVAPSAILPYMASAVPNVDVGLSSRPIKNHWNFFSAGTQSPKNNNCIVVPRAAWRVQKLVIVISFLFAAIKKMQF